MINKILAVIVFALFSAVAIGQTVTGTIKKPETAKCECPKVEPKAPAVKGTMKATPTKVEPAKTAPKTETVVVTGTPVAK